MHIIYACVDIFIGMIIYVHSKETLYIKLTPKRYDVKEWGTCVVYSVNLKFKNPNSIDTWPYPCITICISGDGCIL